MTRDYTRGKIGVFWDVEDFPVPKGRRIREIIGSVLQKKGYKGEVSIKAYGESEMSPFRAEENLDGEFTYVPKRDKYWRLNKMLVDIGWWAVDNPEPHFIPSTLMVVTKNIDEDTEFLYHLQGLNVSYYNVILVVPDDIPEPEEVPLPSVNLMWRWTSLLVGGEPMSKDESLELVAQSKRGGLKFGFISPHVYDESIYNCPYLCG